MPLRNFKLAICLVLTLSLLLFGGCVSPVMAQSPESINTSAVSQPIPENIPQSSPTYANMVVYNLMHTFSCIVVGQSVINQPCVEYQSVKSLSGSLQSVPVLSSARTSHGLLGFVGSTVDGLYTSRPVATHEFTAHLGETFGFVKTAHAQVGGSGNGVLSPVYSIWLVSRNLCYLLMIIIFLSVGLMIMFRSKINPQTVISIQAALPGLVIGLLLITFSYFMASIITDLAFIGTDAVGFFFAQAQPQTNSNGATARSLLQNLQNQNPLTIIPRFVDATGQQDFGVGITQIMSNLEENGFANNVIRLVLAFTAFQYGSQIGSIAGGLGGAAVGALGGVIFPVAGGIMATIGGIGTGASALSGLGSAAGGLVGATFAAWAWNNPGSIANYAIRIILMGMLLVAMFNLLLALLKNYLSIIFYTVTAPFFFLAASLPGRSGIVNEWIRNMLCYVLAFPAVIAVIYFAFYMLTGPNGNAFAVTDAANNVRPFAVPGSDVIGVTGTQTMPLFGGLNLNLINYLLAFAALIATPSIPDIICKAIGKIGPYGQMVEQSIRGSQKDAQGRIKELQGGVGAVQKDAGQLDKAWRGEGQWVWDGKAYTHVRTVPAWKRRFP